jgi:hypothetical protein
MTIDELIELLESCHYAAEVRIAIPGAPPSEMAIIGITSTRELSPERSEPGAAWILAGEIIGEIDGSAWHLGKRHKP